MTRTFRIAAVNTTLAFIYVLVASGAHAARTGYREKSIYDFCKKMQCALGPIPRGNVVIDSAGNIYGTTEFGGAADAGVVFKLTPDGKKYRFSDIHDFGVTDSLEEPTGDLSLDKDGNLYGTTISGTSTSTCGAVFELSPQGETWTFSVIEQFPADGSQGCLPLSGLTYAGKSLGQPWDEFSPLFGSTEEGGTYGSGVVYELISDGGFWEETVIHTFHTSLEPGPLLEDSEGNLWGTTQYGGTNGGGDGIIFELAAGTWKETIPYQFCSQPNCTDGLLPTGRLFMDESGNIFGATFEGGGSTNCGNSYGCGVAFELTAGGTYQVLYNFCSLANCADGAEPEGGLIVNGSGVLLGTTGYGGSGQYDTNQYGAGVAFELVNSGGIWSETVEHDFCSKPACRDGESPDADPVVDASGTIFAVTSGGGETDGNVFQLRAR